MNMLPTSLFIYFKLPLMLEEAYGVLPLRIYFIPKYKDKFYFEKIPYRINSTNFFSYNFCKDIIIPNFA